MASVKKSQTVTKNKKQKAEGKAPQQKTTESLQNKRESTQSHSVKPQSSTSSSSVKHSSATKSKKAQSKAATSVNRTDKTSKSFATEKATSKVQYRNSYKSSGKTDNNNQKTANSISNKEKRTQLPDRPESPSVAWLRGQMDLAAPDASPLAHTFAQQRREYREDTSYKEIQPDWTENQIREYNTLYARDPKEAENYAIQTNDAISAAKMASSRQAIRNAATKDIKSGAQHTADSLAASILFATPEFIDRVAEFSVRGRTTEKSYITPMDYSREVVESISDNLNGVDEYGVAHKVLDEDIPIIGGKGWGDAYQLFHNAAQSLLSRKILGGTFGATDLAFGKTAVLANAFADTATAAMDDARRSGATGKQAMSLALLNGAFEVATELIPLDELMNIKPATTVRDFVKTIAVQCGMEGLGEMVNSGLGILADSLILRDNSQFSRRTREYMDNNGLTEHEAKTKAFSDTLNDVLFDGLAGAASGVATAGAEHAVHSFSSYLQNSSLYSHSPIPWDPIGLHAESIPLPASLDDFYPQFPRTLSPEAQKLQKEFSPEIYKLAWEAGKREFEEFQRTYDHPDAPHNLYQRQFPELYQLALEKTEKDLANATIVPRIPASLLQEIQHRIKESVDVAPENPAASGRNTIASSGEVGEKAIPYSQRGIEIEPRLQFYMEQLPADGAYISDKAGAYSMEDLQILTAETGVEFTMLTIDGKSYMIRGNERGTSIPDELAELLYEKHGDFVCHSHPYIGDLKPSQSDLAFLESLTWQQESAIIDPTGEMIIFDKSGAKEKKGVASERNQKYYDELFLKE